MFATLRLAAIMLLAINAFAQTPSPKVAGDKNQTAGTNNGVMIQNNITVTDSVKKALQQRARDLGDEQGWLRLLTPANDPTPQSSCNIPDNSLAVFLGNFAATCSGDRCTILQDNNANADVKNLLSVRRRGSSLLVQGVVFGEDGKVIVAIEDDKPHINKPSAFGWKRLDDHTLEVTDQQDRTVLHIRFMNKTTLYVEGLFYTPSGIGLKISKDGLQMRTRLGPGMSIHGGCAGNNGTAFAF